MFLLKNIHFPHHDIDKSIVGSLNDFEVSLPLGIGVMAEENQFEYRVSFVPYLTSAMDDEFYGDRFVKKSD